MASTKPPTGARDFLPEDIRRRAYVIDKVRGVYERYGYEPLETPAFENLETLLGKYGEEGNRLIFKILKRGEHESSGVADLALRYDLTVPLARVVAEYQEKLPKVFKRYQIQPVWRADRPQKGRFREFFQCDIDAVGSASPLVEVEQASAVCEILEALGFHSFEIHLNHRQLLSRLLESKGVPVEKHADALISLDKLDKVGLEGVAKDLRERGIGPEVSGKLLTTFEKERLISDITTQLWDAPSTNEMWFSEFERDLPGEESVESLRTIVELAASTPAAKYLAIDPSLARGLSYYTGPIMEIRVRDLAGSLGGGGRYDNLVGMFLGRDIPACGFSLGLERILVVMAERGMFEGKVPRGGVDVVVTFMDDDSRAEAITLAQNLRHQRVNDGDIERELRVDVYPEVSRKFDRVWKHASARGAAIVASCGGNESPGNVGLRDIRKQERIPSVPMRPAASFIRDLVAMAIRREGGKKAVDLPEGM